MCPKIEIRHKIWKSLWVRDFYKTAAQIPAFKNNYIMILSGGLDTTNKCKRLFYDNFCAGKRINQPQVPQRGIQ